MFDDELLPYGMRLELWGHYQQFREFLIEVRRLHGVYGTSAPCDISDLEWRHRKDT